MKLKLILCLCMLPHFFALPRKAQPQQFSNRYGMKMTQNEDGSYALLYAKKYAKFYRCEYHSRCDGALYLSAGPPEKQGL